MGFKFQVSYSLQLASQLQLVATVACHAADDQKWLGAAPEGCGSWTIMARTVHLPLLLKLLATSAEAWAIKQEL